MYGSECLLTPAHVHLHPIIPLHACPLHSKRDAEENIRAWLGCYI